MVDQKYEDRISETRMWLLSELAESCGYKNLSEFERATYTTDERWKSIKKRLKRSGKKKLGRK